MGRPRQFYRVLREVRVADAPMPDSYVHNARKMPGEVVEVVDAGQQSQQEPLSPSQSHPPGRRHSSGYEESDVSYLKLAHAAGWIPLENALDGARNVELLPETTWTEEVASPSFYFRVLVPLDVRTGPDCLAPKVSPVDTKRPNDIVEVARVVTFPQSRVAFVELKPAGWLNVQLPSGRHVLERLDEAPIVTRPSAVSVTSPHNVTITTLSGKEGTLEHGHFFYCVKIAVGIRESPDIMGPRVGKGFHLNTIVEGSQRFTPTGSPITYVKLLHERGWVFESTMDGQVVLSPLHSLIQRDIARGFYRVLDTDNGVPVFSAPSFESPVLSTRLQVIECRERLRLDVALADDDESAATSVVTFLKLRHAPGWVPETTRRGELLVSAIDGDATTIDVPKFYKVQIAVPVRMAPDIDGPRVQGSFPKPVGSIVESSLRYIPPASDMTYVKLAHEPGWIYERTAQGDAVLVALSKEPEKQHGKFYYRTKARVRVLVSPEPTSAVLKYMDENQAFVALLQFGLPDTDLTYVGLKDKGWVALDAPDATKITIERITEAVYNLWTAPPDWVAVGFPNRSWYKVPDEPDVVALETMLQAELAGSVLLSTSQGKDSVPIVRQGRLGDVTVTLEEIKHPANAILLTFPWKQLWWHIAFADAPLVVEVQHGLHGGFRAVYCNGELQTQARLLWDGGDAFTFTHNGHDVSVRISLEGSFFSTSVQYFRMR
ncbi:hypothetical protein SPRG_02229 [Saprolegnia parasitica CBS 223.65]|uniref:Uncharacterized protein n=1 Tax=Saprolegnia parasitica (strain CBS 223.65) TaxID=695850 RepID=A0A067D313_SAPPC|nr:hypothetical protein SPRG_02229 [Saprolegnia parasitica CBS 223.65]KDO33422.1 hypothetical protein SPRG_02229 [Saprolegnia parasitica CBS 223.65]|eukprot:XP_012196168.1 hypothetical protein SPRG_02229 [Saprolegnia parasitica CBS 223.65]